MFFNKRPPGEDRQNSKESKMAATDRNISKRDTNRYKNDNMTDKLINRLREWERWRLLPWWSCQLVCGRSDMVQSVLVPQTAQRRAPGQGAGATTTTWLGLPTTQPRRTEEIQYKVVDPNYWYTVRYFFITVVMSRFVTVSFNQPSHLSYFENCCVQWRAAGLNKVCEKKGGWVIYFFSKQCSATSCIFISNHSYVLPNPNLDGSC